jgi:ribosomal protein S18 acetylase RimI-like enzyme
MNVLYRNFTLKDYAECVEIWKENEQYTESKSLQCMEKAIALNPNMQWVAESDGKIVGFIGASFDGRIVFIYGFSVKKEYQRKGIGSELMRTIEGEALKKGAVEVILFTKLEREGSNNFYKKRKYEREPCSVFCKKLDDKSYITVKQYN